MNGPPIRDEIDRRRLRRGCAIIFISIAAGLILTIAVASIDDLTGLSVPQEAVVIAVVVNGLIVAAGSAIGGWASNEHVVDRAVFGLVAAGVGVVIYTSFIGCIGYVGII